MQTFAIALSHTDAVISIRKSEIHKISNGLISNYLGKTISIFFLNDLFYPHQSQITGHPWHTNYDAMEDDENMDVIIVSYNNRFAGIVVDKVIQQKEIVEKTLSPPIEHIHLFSGATILGTGEVCLVLNVVGILSRIWSDKSTDLTFRNT
ncbi:MAG: chemotaxis protein CheW [Bacteroidia bacterium]